MRLRGSLRAERNPTRSFLGKIFACMLLVLASLQDGMPLPRAEPVELAALLDRVIEEMSFEFPERARCIRAIRRAAGIFVSGDPELLRRDQAEE